jgi:hypothetical protein
MKSRGVKLLRTLRHTIYHYHIGCVNE